MRCDGEVMEVVGGIDIQLFVLCGIRIPGVTFFELLNFSFLTLSLPLRFWWYCLYPDGFAYTFVYIFLSPVMAFI